MVIISDIDKTRSRGWYIREHRKMWRWLAQHPELRKWDYPGIGKLNGLTGNACFLCAYNHLVGGACRYTCAVKWPGGECANEDNTSLYSKYCDTTSLAERSRLALEIANLPTNRRR